MSRSSRPSLLSGDEPAMVIHERAASTRPMLLVCEHAGKAIPKALTGAYPAPLIDMHYGSDIGAGALVRALSERLDVSAVMARYSRLIIDPNRRLDDPTLALPAAEGVPLAANVSLDRNTLQARIDDLYVPFHLAVEAQIKRLSETGVTPVYVAIHSFTPEYAGEQRPWHAGVMWDKDERIARFMIDSLRAVDGLVVGDNEPYSGQVRQDFSVDYHAERNGLANVAFEFRQDLLADEQGIALWVDRLTPLFEAVLSQEWPRRQVVEGAPGSRADHRIFEAAAKQWAVA